MKNIVFIPVVKDPNRLGRSNGYKWCIKSWKYWCNKNGAELFLLEEPLYDSKLMSFAWQRYHLFKLLDENNIDYNQILMVDADTINHPDCPDFFKETEGKYCGVMNDGCYEWVIRSIDKYHDEVFPDMRVEPWNYINGGFQIVNKKHKDFYDEVVKFYMDNNEKLLSIQNEHGLGTDQTPINYLIKKHNIDLKILPQCYNLHHRHLYPHLM